VRRAHHTRGAATVEAFATVGGVVAVIELAGALVDASVVAGAVVADATAHAALVVTREARATRSVDEALHALAGARTLAEVTAPEGATVAKGGARLAGSLAVSGGAPLVVAASESENDEDEHAHHDLRHQN
jgi:hypothetical protein